jgi:predicted SnoaL-like aldol condensation-catalyzing enzyme
MDEDAVSKAKRLQAEKYLERQRSADIDKGVKNIVGFLRLLFTKQKNLGGKIVKAITWIFTIVIILAIVLVIWQSL